MQRRQAALPRKFSKDMYASKNYFLDSGEGLPAVRHVELRVGRSASPPPQACMKLSTQTHLAARLSVRLLCRPKDM
jgi:hypothetical protein